MCKSKTREGVRNKERIECVKVRQEREGNVRVGEVGIEGNVDVRRGIGGVGGRRWREGNVGVGKDRSKVACILQPKGM